MCHGGVTRQRGWNTARLGRVFLAEQGTISALRVMVV
jgi:hypothetical protein